MPCDSAGTAGWHVGNPPYADMQAAARGRGIQMSDLRARQLCAEDFELFDLLIAMDPQNVTDMEVLRPSGNRTPIRLMAHYTNAATDTVPDPYYTRDFDATLDMLEQAVRGLDSDLR